MVKNKVEKDECGLIASKYGSRRGFIIAHWHRLKYIFGRYNHYREVDWSSIDRLVFVCKGNVCRSPFAEFVARSIGVEAISCGIDAIEGLPANKQTIIVAREMGYQLDAHKTKPIMYLVLRKSDLLVAMEPSHAKFLERHLVRKHQCTLLGVWSSVAFPYINDPYGAPIVYFWECLKYIECSVHGLIKNIENKKSN